MMPHDSATTKHQTNMLVNTSQTHTKAEPVRNIFTIRFVTTSTFWCLGPLPPSKDMQMPYQTNTITCSVP